MDASDASTVTGAAAASASAYPRCGQCGAPVDEDQRYCVECGSHRRHVRDPAMQFFATASAATRSRSRGSAPPRRRSRSPNLAMALLIAAVPVAIGIGVLVGRSSTSGDSQLVAALRSQRPEIITSAGAAAGVGVGTGAGGGGTSAASTSAVAPAALTSSFPLQGGYAVELRTLPAAGTDRAAVSSAEQAARARGATGVGLIVQSQFRITPSPPGGAYVVYSGAYRSRAAAQRALAALSPRFPGATVIHVRAAGPSAAGGGGRVLARSVYGSAHQIAGSAASGADLATGRRVVQRIQQTQGKSYVNAQRGLPDQVSIP